MALIWLSLLQCLEFMLYSQSSGYDLTKHIIPPQDQCYYSIGCYVTWMESVTAQSRRACHLVLCRGCYHQHRDTWALQHWPCQSVPILREAVEMVHRPHWSAKETQAKWLNELTWILYPGLDPQCTRADINKWSREHLNMSLMKSTLSKKSRYTVNDNN